MTDGVRCPACGSLTPKTEAYKNDKGTYCENCGHGFLHGEEA